MDRATLGSVTASIEAVAGVLAEARRQGHPSHGGATSFPFVDECLAREAQTLRGVGQVQLADALEALRSDVGATDNA